MTRTCYSCRRSMTLEDAADGQKALEGVHESFVEFEGWVHCEGPPEVFVQENDTELKEAVETLLVCFFPYSIQICRLCVTTQWRKEKGIDKIDDYNKEVKEFLEFWDKRYIRRQRS